MSLLLDGLRRALPGRTISGLDPLSAGWETDVYGFLADQRPLVLRVYSGGDRWDRATTEARAMELLGRLEYPIPRLVAFNSDSTLFGGAYLIMERISGQVMWRHFGHATQDPPQMRLACSLLRRLHGLDATGFASINSFDIDTLRWIAGDLSAAFEPVFTALQQQEPLVGRERRSLIHGDFHFDNILIGPGEAPAVIDWSCAALDDPRVDVAQAMVLAMTNGNPAQAELWRKGYEELSGGPLPHLDWFIRLCLTRRLMTVVVTMVQGSSAIGLRPGLEGELRKQAPRVRELVGLLEQLSGVALPGVHEVLA